jgi:hypothetical protein
MPRCQMLLLVSLTNQRLLWCYCVSACQTVIDIATLTGAAGVALGADTGALFSNTDTLAAAVDEAGRQTGALAQGQLEGTVTNDGVFHKSLAHWLVQRMGLCLLVPVLYWDMRHGVRREWQQCSACMAFMAC